MCYLSNAAARDPKERVFCNYLRKQTNTLFQEGEIHLVIHKSFKLKLKHNPKKIKWVNTMTDRPRMT